MLAVVTVVGCRSPLTASRDGAAPSDVGRADSAADLTADLGREAAPPDLPLPDAPADLAPRDLPAPDLVPPALVPRVFRIVNHASRVAYLDANALVACRQDTPAGWQTCHFFDLGCALPCNNVPNDGNCCVLCEQPEPAMVPIVPGASYVVPWNGQLHVLTRGACTACQCQGDALVSGGTFEASARVFGDFQCGPLPCQSLPGDVIGYANPLGDSVTVSALFGVPDPAQEVVLDITAVPVTDTARPPDLAPSDLALPGDPRRDGWPAPFAEVPGHTFQIAAAATAGDASVPFGGQCRPYDPQAVYQLAFSDSGLEVTIRRSDPIEVEEIMQGTLQQQSDTGLVYFVNAGPAGAQLSVRRDDGVLTAQLALFGSGVPVIWCIDSPMAAVGQRG